MKISNFKFQISNSRREGFTLIELIIVLLIIGIATGLVGIAINRTSGNHRLKTFAKEISAVLRYARSHAVSEKKTYCFSIDRDGRMFKLYTDNTSKDNDEKFVQVLVKSIPEELQITLTGRDPEASFIEFFPIGNSTGGRVELSNQKEKFYFVTVNRITGKVAVEQGES
ncbi:MAG: GspH/FimT family pseudopilin [Nitrospirae bacterium]|nr:GspH/FimT family pseudopilin [Nitrospirota bacterium]